MWRVFHISQGLVVVSGAFYFRRRPEIHKRLMLLASISILDTAIDRFWRYVGVDDVVQVFIPLTMLVLVTIVVGFDWFIRRRPPWLLIGGIVVMSVFANVGIALGMTDAAQSWLLSHVN